MRFRYEATVTALGAIFAAASSACGYEESAGGSAARRRRTMARPESTWPDWARRRASTSRASVWAVRRFSGWAVRRRTAVPTAKPPNRPTGRFTPPPAPARGCPRTAQHPPPPPPPRRAPGPDGLCPLCRPPLQRRLDQIKHRFTPAHADQAGDVLGRHGTAGPSTERRKLLELPAECAEIVADRLQEQD